MPASHALTELRASLQAGPATRLNDLRLRAGAILHGIDRAVVAFSK